MIREVLDEEDFRTYINEGSVIKNCVTIIYHESDLDNLISGGIVTQGNVEFILSDIGYDKIYKILK